MSLRFANAIKAPRSRVNEIVLGRRAITTETALRLGRYFGMSPGFWLNLQARYDLDVADRSVKRKIEQEVFLEMPPKTDRNRPASCHDKRQKNPGGKGLRAIHFWVPDACAPYFKKQAHSQSLAVASSRRARQDQSFVDAVSSRLGCGMNSASVGLCTTTPSRTSNWSGVTFECIVVNSNVYKLHLTGRVYDHSTVLVLRID